MLLHSALHWPHQHKLMHWPMAMDHAVWIWNNLPISDGMSPIEKFTGQKSGNYNHLRATHVWGSPCYVLDPKIVEGKKIPKWDPRSRQGKYMGYSKEHASNAGLILNPKTGYMSVQYHVLYDDQFMSVEGVDEDQECATLDTVDWPSIIQRQGGSEIHYDEADIDFVPDFLDDEWLTNVERHDKEERQRSRQRNQVNRRQGQPQLRNPDDADGNEEVIIVDDEDHNHDHDPEDGNHDHDLDHNGNNDHDDDANDIHGNEGDATDGLAPNEGAAIVPPEGDPAPVARRTRSHTTGPVSNRTRSQSDAPSI